MGLALLQAISIGFGFIVFLVVVVVVAYVLISAIKVVKEYERGVIFRLGGYRVVPKVLASSCSSPSWTTWSRLTLGPSPWTCLPGCNNPDTSARVNAVVYFRVVDPNKSVIEVENHVLATSQISQTTLRSVLGQKDLDQLLTNREINEELQAIIDEQTDPWGVKVSVVEVKDVEIPPRCSGLWPVKRRASGRGGRRS